MSRRSAPTGPTSASLRVLLLLFVGSGASALIYEIIWFQLLQVIIGSSAVSLGVLLGTFMGGMCLGSWLLPRLSRISWHPLRVYAALELGIGAAALLLLCLMPLVNDAYAAIGGSVAVRAVLTMLCLLPPTLLMGATLPALARWIEVSPRGIAWLGFFYAGNIAGGVLGSLAAGFYILRVYDVSIGTYVAVLINILIAVIALAVARGTAIHKPAEPLNTAKAQVQLNSAGRAQLQLRSTVYVAIALSGLTALSAQIVWTRLLALLFGGTVYTFSLVLAVFLFGLGVGSTAGAIVSRRIRQPRVALGWCQCLLAPAMFLAAYFLLAYLPFDRLPPEVVTDPTLRLLTDLKRCAEVVLPASMLWGASFPIALASLAAPGDEPGRLIGGVYAANTLGAIAGALGAGLWLVGRVGSQTTQQILIVISAVSGAIVLLTLPAGRSGIRRATAAAWIVIALLLSWYTPAVPGVLVAFGRQSANWVGLSDITYVGEGVNAFVAVSQTPNGAPIYHNSGKVQASSEGDDMRLQRMLGHFSHLMPKQPADVLVIGLGAGMTAGAVTIAPAVKQVTIVEIEPLVPKAVAAYFADYNYRVLDDPKVKMLVDDGRHFLLTTDRKFDVITSDPLDPWIKGAATLFTEQFFEVVRAHLRPGGVLTQFVQLYGSNTEAVKSEISTFVKVFPSTVVFGNLRKGQGYDLVLVGQVEPMQLDVDAMQAKLDDPANARVAQSLRDVGISSAIELLGNYAGDAESLRPWLAGAAINTDRNLRLQYLAGMTLTTSASDAIYAEMLQYTRFPDRLFTGSPASLQALRARIAAVTGKPL
jgi:spermidine synthase